MGRLIVLLRVFCMGLLSQKYLCYFIIRHFISIIQNNYNKPYRLVYKVDLGKL